MLIHNSNTILNIIINFLKQNLPSTESNRFFLTQNFLFANPLYSTISRIYFIYVVLWTLFLLQVSSLFRVLLPREHSKNKETDFNPTF